MSLQTRLTALAQAIGADIKQIKTDIAGHTHPSSGGGTDPWSVQALTTAWTNSTITQTDVFTGFLLAANARYIVDILASVQAAAATTGVQVGLAGPASGVTRSAVKIVSAATNATDKIDHVSLNSIQVATAGLTIPSLLMVQAIIETGATVPANTPVRLQARSEVAGSLVTIHPGSSMRWRTI